MATPEQFAFGGIIPDPPRRFWHYPATQLSRHRAFQALLATDEFHNPTIALGLPYVGMWVLAYPRRLNAILCGDEGCQEPTCEFYQQ
ncbi:hypothetical protein [Bacillus mobilis]